MHAYLACMFFNNVADIIQAKPESLYRLCITLRHTEKLFKYVLNVFRRYTSSIVPDPDNIVAIVFSNINMDLHSTIGIFDGIINNVLKGSFKVKPVTLYENRDFSGQPKAD